MGIDRSFGLAFAKSQMAAGGSPADQRARSSSASTTRDKPLIVPIARQLADLGFNIIATGGTHKVLAEAGVPVQRIPKINEGSGRTCST